MIRSLDADGIIAGMGQRRVEAILAGYAAVDRRDYESVRRGYHEDAVFEFPEEDILHSTLRGPETFTDDRREDEDERDRRDGCS